MPIMDVLGMMQAKKRENAAIEKARKNFGKNTARSAKELRGNTKT